MFTWVTLGVLYTSYYVRYSLSPPLYISANKRYVYLARHTECDVAYVPSSSVIRHYCEPKGWRYKWRSARYVNISNLVQFYGMDYLLQALSASSRAVSPILYWLWAWRVKLLGTVRKMNTELSKPTFCLRVCVSVNKAMYFTHRTKCDIACHLLICRYALPVSLFG